MKTVFSVNLPVAFFLYLMFPALGALGQDGISPYAKNPYYWQCKKQPVMLLGGSKDDNLFQIDHLVDHLDLMEQTGANYVRNTMSSRDKGNLRAFKRLSDGRYDLDQWNPAYWLRFEKMLKETSPREIFVQIEFWDQHDYNRGRWDDNPWNPGQNVNYTVSETQLKGNGYYADVKASGSKKMDFFMTVPGLQNDRIVLAYQQKFVDKVLSYTFRYDHVLYTITNELFKQHSSRWSRYWAEYLHDKASQVGIPIQVTEMFQAVDMHHQHHKISIDHPETFTYLDISQNSVQMDDQHWEHLQWVRETISGHVRPINHTKIYGGDSIDWTHGDEHGVECFWRNIFGGAATVRFHRPPYGIGLNEHARKHIRSARILLEEINIFECKPDASHHLLFDRAPGEAYLTCIPNKAYAIYFPEGGSVRLDLSKASDTFRLQWLHIEKGEWTEGSFLQAGKKNRLNTPDKIHGWVALIHKPQSE